ncbi:hypothetical protein B0A55_07122 [Friedmanniomyces simplex]|uniref:Uncharacterized protein n=1 Tax=Friedmanniomyces simplex TaxID=329884 RepID=A0A4U0XE07_9PEZI|nr:hypothetical protein B0A55_07122 [Friedmanniomyces simplex]
MSTGKIILYDLARRGGNTCWSANVWKVRLVLNYKRLPYTTTWLTHPEIEPTLTSLGIPPNTSGPGSAYTLPAIRLPNGEYLMDSTTIVQRLEELYPEPTLHLDTGVHDRALAVVGKTGFALLPVFMPRVARSMIVETSVPWFCEARRKKFGMSLEELESTRGGERAWEAADPGLKELNGLMKEEKRNEGPFVLGSEVSYADFVLVALLEGMRRIGEDLFERIVGGDEGLLAIYEECRRWTEKDV